eukprot:comp24177_c0_seq5/m.44229 comp24177_c0_seq5/g.44229  ORF comp24177_c0_seq5/g.44229 comp24177_c0_seq5/m.44229 type:complete len:649 (-) comp24177_c0_seq5:19-1965(-)
MQALCQQLLPQLRQAANRAAVQAATASLCRVSHVCRSLHSTPSALHGHGHSHGERGHSHGPEPKGIPVSPEEMEEARRRLKRKHADGFTYDHGMTKEQAATEFGKFIGIPDLKAGEVVALDDKTLCEVLTAAPQNKLLEKAMFAHADAVTERFFGPDIYYRGIVEFSNVCQKDCFYCGIRKHQKVHRYSMPKEEIVESAMWAYERKFGSLMLQSGEVNTEKRLAFLEDVIRTIRTTTIAKDLERQGRPTDIPLTHQERRDLGLAVALSVGELDREKYQRLWDAGGHRFLLRIETTNPDLYKTMHPPDHKWETRMECIHTLKDIGFQVGTGVMIGLPGQTLLDLARDLVFFREEEIDMIGMGPYITQEGTPLAKVWFDEHGTDKKANKTHMEDMFELTTRMIALARITTGNVNIAATTAMQAIKPNGREIALRRGANVMMPILTPTKYRVDYQLYEGKPCITDTAEECRSCLSLRVNMVGKRIKDGIWADPPHFFNPVTGRNTPPGTRMYHTSARHLHTSRQVLAQGQEAAAANKGATLMGPQATHMPRLNIGLFGAMNAGKSTLMNRITRQETSIVDSTPGTTADTKIALMELHDLGPVKLFDTAGIDEEGMLGEKKRRKTLGVLKETDVAVLVVDPTREHARYNTHV